jgi:hypothetical protein
MTDQLLQNVVIDQLDSRKTLLVRDVAYTAEKLLGDLWGFLTDGERRRAGICISLLVNTGDLSWLVPVERKHEYPKHYMLK